MRHTAIFLALILLVSCQGATVTIHSSPPGAKVTFEGKEYTTPFTLDGVANGTYEISGKRTGYLPARMTIKVEGGPGNFSLVFAKESDRPTEFATNVPADGIRIRSNPDPEMYYFQAYDPVTGKLGKEIAVEKTDNPLFDLKLLRKASGIENASFITKLAFEDQRAWVDCQPGGDLITAMKHFKAGARPDWKYPTLIRENVARTNSVVSNGESVATVGGVKIGSSKTDRIFQAHTLGNSTVWSAIDSDGIQDVWLYEGGKVKNIWHGEYGIGANDYLSSVNSVATISGDFIFAMLTTDEGYKIAALDKSGKIIASKRIYDFSKDIQVKRFDGFYGLSVTNTKLVQKTFTFDGKTFLDMVETSNCDFTKTSGIWLKIGQNYELYFNENLSAMLAFNGKKHEVVYVGPRF